MYFILYLFYFICFVVKNGVILIRQIIECVYIGFPPSHDVCCLSVMQAMTARARCWSLRCPTRWCPTWTWAACLGPSCSSSTSCTAAGSEGTAPSSRTSSSRLWRASSKKLSIRTSALANNLPARSTSARRRSRSALLFLKAIFFQSFHSTHKHTHVQWVLKPGWHALTMLLLLLNNNNNNN